MRFKNKPNYSIGDCRIVCKYLLIPRRCDNETRWLEYAKYVEKYTCKGALYGWEMVRWETK